MTFKSTIIIDLYICANLDFEGMCQRKNESKKVHRNPSQSQLANILNRMIEDKGRLLGQEVWLVIRNNISNVKIKSL